MDIQKLKYFVSVAESLSFTAAAAETGVSQSAISQQISELEKQLDTQLIIRNKRPLQLTWAGKVLLQEASGLINLTTEAIKKIHLASQGITGYLKIGFLGGVEKTFLPQAIREMRAKYPAIYASMFQYNWAMINEALMRQDLDVAFTLSHRLNDYPDIVAERILTDFMCVAIHRSHPLASRKMISVADLEHEPFVLFSRSEDYLLTDLNYKMCADYGFTPNVVNQARDLGSLMFMVEAGLGIMLAPGPIREVVSPDVLLIELTHPKRFFDVMVAWNQNLLNASVPLFVKHLSAFAHPASPAPKDSYC